MITKDVWLQYQETKDPKLYEQLVTAYLPLVDFVANKLHSTMPSFVDKDDLKSDGNFGLMEAIKRFDVERGVKFESFAIIRIRGAMIDKLRSNDWLPRSVKSKAKDVKEAREFLEQTLDRAPTLDEISDHLEISTEYVRKVDVHSSASQVGTLDAVQPESNSSLGDSLEGISDMDSQFAIQAVRDYLVTVLEGLTEKERIIFTLYYYEDLTLSEIGRLFGVTESRICQIHGKAIEDARLAFQNMKL